MSVDGGSVSTSRTATACDHEHQSSLNSGGFPCRRPYCNLKSNCGVEWRGRTSKGDVVVCRARGRSMTWGGTCQLVAVRQATCRQSRSSRGRDRTAGGVPGRLSTGCVRCPSSGSRDDCGGGGPAEGCREIELVILASARSARAGQPTTVNGPSRLPCHHSPEKPTLSYFLFPVHNLPPAAAHDQLHRAHDHSPPPPRARP